MGRSHKVLIAPSWAPGNIMESCLRELVDVLLDAGYDVTVRPHPEFMKRRRELLDRYERNFEGKDSFRIEKDLGSGASLHENDFLITDWSGIALEYAFGTERPVLYIDTPRKVSNPEYERLNLESMEVTLRNEIGKRVLPENLKDVPAVLNSMHEEKDAYRRKMQDMRNHYVFHFGHAAQVSADAMIRMFEQNQDNPGPVVEGKAN